MGSELAKMDACLTHRDLTEEDIPMVLNYWFHSPPGYIEAMGVDPAKLPPELEMEKNLRQKCRLNQALPSSKSSALVILHDNEPIGFHTIYPLIEGDHGVFHAHIARPEFRGRGLGARSYVKACKIFVERFSLIRVLFKTPVQNTGAIRVKQKLGIRCIGDEVIDFGILKSGTHAKVFELTREEAGMLSVGSLQ